MKNFKKILVVGIIVGSVGFSMNALGAQLTEQQVKDIVTKEVPNGQITKFELDNEHGKLVYEIEMMDGNIEKEFDIDAETGAILKSKQEQKANPIGNVKISYEQARDIALKQSNNGKFKEVKLKNKNGSPFYKVELLEGSVEREFFIDANTGELLKKNIFGKVIKM